MADTEDITYRINSDADCSCDHILNCYKLFGKIIGKAIFERIPLNSYLDRSIIKHILGKPIELDDIYYYDKQVINKNNNVFIAIQILEIFIIK